MRKLGIDYGDARVGIAMTDALNITVQGIETIHHQGNDKIILKRLEEFLNEYEIDTFVVGMPINMNGSKAERVELTEKFTVAAHKTMNFLNLDNKKKKNIVDTISAVYILETYMKKIENKQE